MIPTSRSSTSSRSCTGQSERRDLFLLKLQRKLIELRQSVPREQKRTHPLVHTIGRILSDRKVPKGLPHLDVVECLSQRAVRILGFNPGSHTLQGTNTYLIGTGAEKLLIDTGESISSDIYVRHLFDVVFPATKTTNLKSIILTHGHGDHLGGVVAILKECKTRNWPEPSVHKKIVTNGKFPAVGFHASHISHGEVFSVDGATVRTIYTPGHTDDHVCFVLEEDKALLSGDCILGCGTAVFDELHSYMQSLKLLRSLITQGVPTGLPAAALIPIEHIYPGHGPIVGRNVLGKIEEYIHHRELRETQICDCLGSNISDGNSDSSTKSNAKSNSSRKMMIEQWLSSWDIVCRVYPPSLPFHTKLSAQINVLHHLEKLEVDGIVKSKWPDLWKMQR